MLLIGDNCSGRVSHVTNMSYVCPLQEYTNQLFGGCSYYPQKRHYMISRAYALDFIMCRSSCKYSKTTKQLSIVSYCTSHGNGPGLLRLCPKQNEIFKDHITVKFTSINYGSNFLIMLLFCPNKSVYGKQILTFQKTVVTVCSSRKFI